MTDKDGITALITGGLGATLGGIITAIVQVVSRRSESRATAADLVTRAASNLVDRLEKENAELRARISRLEKRNDD
jgi:NAD(P)H-hydrate repair Nnr-like enzyme with NAD(P)H-hydrate dehydratase domain